MYVVLDKIVMIKHNLLINNVPYLDFLSLNLCISCQHDIMQEMHMQNPNTLQELYGMLINTVDSKHCLECQKG